MSAMRFMETRAIPATKAVENGGIDEEKPASTEEAGGFTTDVVDISKIHRECPRKQCGTLTLCKLPGGVCCGKGDYCCEAGHTCLTTDPPTCIADPDDEVERCADAECADNFHCPHEGVSLCCLGGKTCCMADHRCVNTNPPTCRLMDTQREINEHEERNEIAEDDAGNMNGEKDAEDREAREDASGNADGSQSIPGDSENHLLRYTASYVNLCGMGRTCPNDWKTFGKVGALLLDSQKSSSDFAIAPNAEKAKIGDYIWAHPQLCCAEDSSAEVEGVTIMVQHKCPEGTRSKGEGGNHLSLFYYCSV